MTVHFDTSALEDALTGPRRSIEALIAPADGGHRIALSSIVLYEWLRGPRVRAELMAQEDLFPADAAVRSTWPSLPTPSPMAPRSGRSLATPIGTSPTCG